MIADDAVRIDTTGRDIDEVVAEVLRLAMAAEGRKQP
jgi:cytidylate kinase